MPFIFTGSSQPSDAPAQRMMTFLEAVQTCLEKYFCFNGRAGRSEYWWWVLAYGLPQALLCYCTNLLSLFYVGGPLFLAYSALYTVWGAGIVPAMAVSVRRLHDTGLSGWWLLLLYLPGILAYALLLPWLALIGLGLIIYFQSRPSEKKANKYGDIPCTASSQPDAPGQRRMSFTESVETCLKKSFCFKGRASRSEYWWWILAYNMILLLLLYCAAYCVYLLLEKDTLGLIIMVGFAVLCVGLFPALAVCVRRLHYTGLRGWWLLLLCVPVISVYVLGTVWVFAVISCLFTYFLSRPSEKRSNKYGDVPCLEAAKGA